MFAVDAVLRDEDGATHLAEIKWTRLDPVPLRMLRDWAARLKNYDTSVGGAKLILIVSGRVDDAHRAWIDQQFDISVWDGQQLKLLANSDDRLLAELQAFDEGTKQLEAERVARQSSTIYEPSAAQQIEAEENIPRESTGEAFIARLAATPFGQPGAKEYERICIEIIDYLFGNYLVDARPQSRTEDGLDIFDVVYRVRPAHSFWDTLTRDFRARVIMFEFKNYTSPVGSKQVYTTERYMSASAMRPICFLVSRLPAHDHAELAAFGAMRETGKLLIFLSDKDLVMMLRFRDAEMAALRAGGTVGEDPSVVLDQKIYQFLATMAR